MATPQRLKDNQVPGGRAPSPARLAAFKTLTRLEETACSLHLEDCLHEICDAARVDRRDRKLAYEIACGCIRHMTWLEQVIGSHSSRPAHQLDPPLRWILLMGLYQIMFLDRVTPYAAVNESVLLCHHLGHAGWMAFANGVLRHVVHEHSTPGFVRPAFSDLSIQFSHPRWLIDEYQHVFGADRVPAILEWNNQIPQRHARARCPVPELMAELGATLVEAASEVGPTVVRVRDMAAVIASPAFAAGKLYIMQPWSIKTIQHLPLEDGWTVLDMCAAPGGKSIAMADAAKVEILALDITPSRLAIVNENARRCNVTSILTKALDARKCSAILSGRHFNAVLLDAPCTNLGVIQRHPEIKWRVAPKMIAEAAARQLDLMREGTQCLAPGGWLLYAVCTSSIDETTGLIEKVHTAIPSLQLVRSELTCPGQNASDGGFWALFKKLRAAR